MDHAIELIFALKQLGAHYLTTSVLNIRSPCCRVMIFYWIENSMHLEVFYRRGRRWVYHRARQLQLRLHICFQREGVSYTMGHTIGCPEWVKLNIAHTIYHDSAVMWLGMHELAYLATLMSLTSKYRAITLRNQRIHRETQTHSTYWTKVHPRIQLVEKFSTHRLVSMFLSTLSSGSTSLTFINKIEWRKSLLKPL